MGTDGLIIDSIAAALGLPVIEESKVALIVSPPAVARGIQVTACGDAVPVGIGLGARTPPCSGCIALTPRAADGASCARTKVVAKRKRALAASRPRLNRMGVRSLLLFSFRWTGTLKLLSFA